MFSRTRKGIISMKNYLVTVIVTCKNGDEYALENVIKATNERKAIEMAFEFAYSCEECEDDGDKVASVKFLDSHETDLAVDIDMETYGDLTDDWSYLDRI